MRQNDKHLTNEWLYLEMDYVCLYVAFSLCNVHTYTISICGSASLLQRMRSGR